MTHQTTMGDGWHVVCVGELMIDIVVRLPGALATGSDTPAPIEFRSGGSAANTASWLVKLGTATTLVARVGDRDDPFYDMACNDLPGQLAAGLIEGHHRTGCCVVLLTSDGERTMVPDAGANAHLVPEDLHPHAFVPGRHLHLSGYLLLGPARPAGLRALALARDAGMTISVDASSAAPLRALGAEAFLDLVGTGLLLFANTDEAAVLARVAEPLDAARVLARLCGQAVVKCGPDGAIWAGSDGRTVRSPIDVVDVQDTTGAGDAFAAGYLHAIGLGASPAAALRSGNSLAGGACLRFGGRPESTV